MALEMDGEHSEMDSEKHPRTMSSLGALVRSWGALVSSWGVHVHVHVLIHAFGSLRQLLEALVQPGLTPITSHGSEASQEL